MGVYLNPGNDRFQKICSLERYVDKTGQIALTNKAIDTGANCVCISRPAGFGKSMTASMLAAYYGKNGDFGELFASLEAARLESYGEHLNQHNVIFINIQKAFCRTASIGKMLRYIQKEILAELREAYGNWIPEEETILSAALEKLYSRSNEKFIFIIDEWDSAIRMAMENEKAQKTYMDFLGDLFKDQPYVSLVCMTGVLPVKMYNTYSILNIFDDFSMENPAEYAKYTGFTEEEVIGLCEKARVDFESVKDWYGGYTFPGISYIYNPKSVMAALRLGEFTGYWTKPPACVELKKYINMNFDGLKDAIIRMMTGEGIAIHTEKLHNALSAFQSKDDLLLLLVHLGYLAFDRRTFMVFIPNAEMLMEFCDLVGGEYWKPEDE